MAEWSFQRRLITGVIVVCLLAILSSGGSLFASRILIANMDVITSGVGRDLDDAKALQLAGVQKIADVRASLLTGGKAYAPEVRAGSARFRELTTKLESRIENADARTLLIGVLDAERDHEDAFERALLAYSNSHAPASARDPNPVLSRGARLDQALTQLVARIDSDRHRSLAASEAAVKRAEPLLTTITAATILLLMLLCVMLITALSRSYRRQASARLLAEQGQSRAERGQTKAEQGQSRAEQGLIRAEQGQQEAKASLSEAEAVSHLKDEFLATVSHELRNPLAPILTWTQLLRSGTLDREKTKRALEVIERNVNSQAQLIDDLVDVSRVASGKFRLDVRPVDLVPVIKAAADAQGPASDAKKIRLQLVLDERAGVISGDSERLQQVMWNLISNAIKFTPKGGTVQVVLQRAESHIEVSVSDSGVGIDSEFLPHVFEPFRQGTGGSMRRHGGLGLGLSIVRHIVELHGGEINAFSAGPELGSKFTIKFPLLATAQVNGANVRRHPIAGDALANVHLARLDGVRVLVVDDEPSASEALLELFSSCGAEARVAGSAADALATFDTWVPDVLISDIAMPMEDGYSLIRKVRLRSVERGGVTPAVALTAYAKIEDRVTILAAGFQMYLSKPADPNELIAVVGSLARRQGTNGIKSVR